jgi:hypothetical protein
VAPAKIGFEERCGNSRNTRHVGIFHPTGVQVVRCWSE